MFYSDFEKRVMLIWLMYNCVNTYIIQNAPPWFIRHFQLKI